LNALELPGRGKQDAGLLGLHLPACLSAKEACLENK